LIAKWGVDLTKYFDKVDLGVESIDDWSEFEAWFAEQEFHKIASLTNVSTKYTTH
jgi:hypothetical protein